MFKGIRLRIANTVLACIVAFGCVATAVTAAFVDVARNATIVYANEWKHASSGWWYQTGQSYARGWKQIESTWYYFGNNGWMKTGWQFIDGSWYYFSSSGAMRTGWQKVNGSWYYFNSSGSMRTGWNKVGTTWYYHNKSGAMLTGWQSIDHKWYYFNGSGAMAADCWIGNYYLNSDGAMAMDVWVDGGRYFVGSDGAWIPGYDDQASAGNDYEIANIQGYWHVIGLERNGATSWKKAPHSFVCLRFYESTFTWTVDGSSNYGTYVFDEIDEDGDAWYTLYISGKPVGVVDVSKEGRLYLKLMVADYTQIYERASY